MSLPAKSTKFQTLLRQLQQDFPATSFEIDEIFHWSCEAQTIYYNELNDDPIWSLLHELGHMNHGHDRYSSDGALIRMEIEAWDSAQQFGANYGVTIDEDHIQDCMDSYRFWQHKRSTCPTCTLNGVEVSSGSYRCINCRTQWQVGDDRFCRVYRSRVAA